MKYKLINVIHEIKINKITAFKNIQHKNNIPVQGKQNNQFNKNIQEY